MGERRKRKSLWDMEDNTKHFSGMSERNSWTEKEHHSSHDSGRHHEISASGTNAALRSREHPGHPSRESIEENPVAPINGIFTKNRQNVPERKEIVGENREYQNMSPRFDGTTRDKYNHTLENDSSHSRRYLERGRSRSRSRSRTRGRSRSRSLSRGRGKERGRGRGRSRSRSRSHSPVGDNRRQSYGWSDRRSVPDKSSQICRDFASGRCKRGSQCRFFHSKNIVRGDGDFVGDDKAESWRKRADHSQNAKNSYSRGPASDLQGGISDPYRGENEQYPNKSRNAVPCKDFIKGKCRWGDTCRFSHHFASDENFGNGTRYTSLDKDIGRQPYKNDKSLCKYFAAGMCDRDNCRFSHEDPKLNSLEGKRREEHSLVVDNVKPGGWSETIDTIMENTGDTTKAEGHDKWGDSLDNENKSWDLPEWRVNSVNRDKKPLHPEKSGSYGRDIGTADSIGKENMANKQEHLVLHGSQLQNQDGNSNAQGQNTLQEDQSFWKQNVSPVSHIQQQHDGVVENSRVSSFQSGVLDEARNTTNPVPVSGQNMNHNGDNVFHGHSSNGFSSDLNGPEAQIIPNLLTSENLAQLTNSAVAIAAQPIAPITNPTVFPTQRFVNEQSQKNAEIGGSDSHKPVNPMQNGPVTNEHRNHTEENNQTQVGHSGSTNLMQERVIANSEVGEGNRAIDEENKGVDNNKQSDTLQGSGKIEENNADKDMRMFKNFLIEFVKEILKPTWKEGRMSKEVHKTIVKKVVDKITSTIQADHVPKTQDKVEQYLSVSKPKIAKLVEAYVGRCLKTDS